MVTYENLFAFAMVIIAAVALAFDISNRKR